MDCKQNHGEIIQYLGDAHWTCVECKTKFDNSEIVHITKAQHEAREDVKKAARDALKSYRTPDDDAFPDKMIVLQQNLDALDKGE